MLSTRFSYTPASASAEDRDSMGIDTDDAVQFRRIALGLATDTGYAVLLANDEWIGWRNAADSDFVQGWKLNTDNYLEPGAPLALGAVQFATNLGSGDLQYWDFTLNDSTERIIKLGANTTMAAGLCLTDDDGSGLTAASLRFWDGFQLQAGKSAGDILDLAAYDVDGTAWQNILRITSGDTPTADLWKETTQNSVRLARRVIELEAFSYGTALATGDGKVYFAVPSFLNGWNLVSVEAILDTASTSGAVTFQVRNVTQAADMLTTALTVDQDEKTSATAATPAVIDTDNDDVATGDILAIDCDGAGTGATGAWIPLGFEKP